LLVSTLSKIRTFKRIQPIQANDGAPCDPRSVAIDPVFEIRIHAGQNCGQKKGKIKKIFLLEEFSIWLDACF
jgi:hypothetical protein